MAADAHPHFVFGLQTGLSNSLWYLDEQTIIFPSGKLCVLYNFDKICQRFISATDRSQGLRALAVSPDQRYLAVSECVEEGVITIYDPQEQRIKKVLTAGDIPVQEFISVAFSHDSKYLIGQSGAPDWTLFYWLWENQRVIATEKTGSATNPIQQVSFNPQDNTQICVSGYEVFKLYQYNEGILQQFNSKKLECHNFLSHGWTSENHVVMGTDTGRLMVFKSGKLHWETTLTIKRSLEKKQEEVDALQLPRITAITAYSKGFACSAGPGMVCLFEKMEDNYRKTREIRIPPDPLSNDPTQAEQQEVVSMRISPLEETLTTSTDQGQLYSISLASAELNKVGETAYFEYLSHSVHTGTIRDLAICIRKPLIVTCSQDRTVRIWNYQTRLLEVHKEFLEEPYSVAFHPSGHHILVGFSKKLHLMNLLIDDMRTIKEFSLSQCNECVFSNGGHMFAAANDNVIHIYSFTTFENIQTLKGHKGKVRSIVWSEDDRGLVSCGMEGAVCEWDTLSSKPESECLQKTCMYTCVTLSPDTKSIFAVGTDCVLREIQGCQIVTELPADTIYYSALALSRTGKVLFTGTSAGTVTVNRCPLAKLRNIVEFQGHSARITKMAVTFDDRFLLTISDDGCLLIWKILWNRYGLKSEKTIYYSEEILIPKSDLENKNDNMMGLKLKVQELQTENDFQLELRDLKHQKELKEVKKKFTEEIDFLKSENQTLRAEMEKMERVHKDMMVEMMEKQTKYQQNLEERTHQKLMNEYEMSESLHLKGQQMLADCERELKETKETHKKVMNNLTQQYETKLEKSLRMLKECEDNMNLQKREYEEIIRMMYEDTDKEIVGTRVKFETMLKEEREAGLRLKDENGIMRKKFARLQKEIADKKMEIELQNEEIQNLHDMIKALEEDNLILKEEVRMRNLNIEEKVVENAEMTKMNTNLEHFKYILEHRNKELLRQLEPKDKSIKEMKQHIQKMEKELEQSEKLISDLSEKNENLGVRLKASESDQRQGMQRVFDLEILVQRFKGDLQKAIGLIQDPKQLKNCMVALHRTYALPSKDDLKAPEPGIMMDGRQWEDLGRKLVASLKKRLVKDNENYSAEKFRLMQDNSFLISEISDLRRELKIWRDKASDYANQLTVFRRKKRHGSLDLNILSGSPVVQLNPEVELEKIIELQSKEIERLRVQILSCMETDQQGSSTSTGPLPPTF